MPEHLFNDPIPPGSGLRSPAFDAGGDIRFDLRSLAAYYLEATPEQLAQPLGPGTAIADLRGSEGFEFVYDTARFAAQRRPEDRALLRRRPRRDEANFTLLASLLPTLMTREGLPLAQAIAANLRLLNRAPSPSKAGAKPTTPCVRQAPPPLTPDAITTLLADLLEAAEATPTHDSPSPREAQFASELVPSFLIWDQDERERILGSDPALCALWIKFSNGEVGEATGFFVAPRVVVTAGHAVYDHRNGRGPAVTIAVFPGVNAAIPLQNGASHPFGSARAWSIRVTPQWYSYKHPEYDFACVVLPTNPPTTSRDLPFAEPDAPTLMSRPAALNGYPAEQAFAELWGMNGPIRQVELRRLVYDIDTSEGQSGAPLTVRDDYGVRFAVGVHSGGDYGGNSAIRLAGFAYDKLQEWIANPD